jgi:ABC-type nitrate/sulfonate/bicarbonate transport system permease component
VSVAVRKVGSARFRRLGGRSTTAPRSRSAFVLPLLGVLSLFACWEVAAWVVSLTSEHPNQVLPSISRVIGTDLPAIGTVGKENATPSYSGAFHVLWKESLVTLGRVVIGSAIGAGLGIGIGFVVALSGIGRRLLQPPVTILRQLPLLALSILFLNWFGGSDTGIYAFIGFGVGTMLFVNTVAAVRNVPRSQILFARTLGASQLRTIRTVFVPAITPELLSGVKIAVGLAWAMALGAEYLGTQTGLGRLMLYFELFQYTGRMIVVVVLFVAWALLTHICLTVFGNWLTRWMP